MLTQQRVVRVQREPAQPRHAAKALSQTQRTLAQHGIIGVQDASASRFHHSGLRARLADDEAGTRPHRAPSRTLLGILSGSSYLKNSGTPPRLPPKPEVPSRQ